MYQLKEIDWDYISPSSQNSKGLSNRDLAKLGNTPFGPDDMYIELHHLTQREPGGMVEIYGSIHDKYSSTLYGLVGNNQSFRNNKILYQQYDKFRKQYWKDRINLIELEESLRYERK